MQKIKSLVVVLILFLVSSCATYKPQYKDSYRVTNIQEDEIVHSFFLIGDAGNSPVGTESDALKAFKKELEKASKNSTAIFLGDNIYPNGLPKKKDKERAFAEHQLNAQIGTVENFKGETIFIPGNHDWYSNGLKGLKRQEKFIEDKLGKNTFLPENGCPIKKVNISEGIVMIIIDSEWYLTRWDKHPTINDDCEIKTRIQFFDEFEGLIKKARGKTTIIAIHHPLFTNGQHGGQYSLKQQLFPINDKIPLPILGTVINLVRKTSGISPADIQNKRYVELKKRIITLSQENENVVFVSGHEHNLQYLVQENIPQIISGSGSKVSATRNIGSGLFSYGTSGYARLDVLKNGSSHVRFYSAKENKLLFQAEVLSSKKAEIRSNFNDNISKSTSASVYSEAETTKGFAYKLLWGKRYREAFKTKVNAPNVNLDTLFGGLKPVRKGGGHQSKSLRLKDSEGREYVMRALRKNAVQYLQAVAFKNQYIEGQFDDTYTENLLLDVFTGSHPYGPFTIGALADAIGVYHSNPVLYYVPKQNTLGQFNAEFGDELYMIEERASSGHGNEASFGFSNKIISTRDMLENLRKNERFKVDEEAYLRARLFDMLIGDWDRHEDQWRWATFKEGKNTIYKPVPRDRDQAFSIMSNGALLSFVTSIIPTLRLMKAYKVDLKSPKWFNLEPYPLDMTLITTADKTLWNNQVKHIQTNLTDEIIDEAFLFFPEELNQTTIREIKIKLKARRKNLQKISDKYYKHINKFAVIKGTDKDDWFEIERLNNQTKITGFRIKNGKKEAVFYQRTYNSKLTKEIWIYALDDDDVFKVTGQGNDLIKIVLIGGQNKDIYNIENGKKVYIYDYKSKASEFITNNGNVNLINDYETNVYDYKKLKNNTNQLLPSIGSNPDDGFRIGISNTFTIYGFERNPFTSQHKLSATYYFATNGFDFAYKGEFANVINKWNLGFEATYTSPNYAVNFFGFGNETPNDEANSSNGIVVNLDYNRVKFSKLKFEPSLIWKGELGANFKAGISYESIEVEETQNRFINTFYQINGKENNKSFVGAEATYSYENKDNKAFPTLGMETSLKLGYKTELSKFNAFGYVIPSLGFNYKLIPNGQLVLATKFKGHIIFGNNFEFYHGANLGANNGLRAYRNERFTGKNAFYQSTDIRLNLRKVKTSILPLNVGFYTGFDYGRVWLNRDFSNNWNTSIGGGIFASMADMMTLNLSAFHGNDGLRLAFKLGFGF